MPIFSGKGKAKPGEVAMILGAAMMMGTNDHLYMNTMNRVLKAYPEPRKKRDNYNEANSGGPKAKERRLKQLARMPEHERTKQCL